MPFGTEPRNGTAQRCTRCISGSRMVASGGRLLGLTQVAVLKDIQLPGLEVDSYRNRKVTYSTRFTERVMPLCQIPSLVWNAVAPLAPESRRAPIAWHILKQMLVFTYLYWMVELRRVHGLSLRLRSLPGNAAAEPDKAYGCIQVPDPEHLVPFPSE